MKKIKQRYRIVQRGAMFYLDEWNARVDAVLAVV